MNISRKEHDFSWWASQDEREEQAEIKRQQAAQDANDLDDFSWTASNGQEIALVAGCNWEEVGMVKIYVDGRKVAVTRDLVDLPSSPVPGIVAKIGNVGLTAERVALLKKMMGWK